MKLEVLKSCVLTDQICIAKCLYSDRNDLLGKFVHNHGSRLQKVHCPLTCVAQKRRCLNYLIYADERH